MKDLWDKITTGVCVVIALLLLFVLGMGLWSQRQWFPFVGGTFIVVTIVLLALAPFTVFLLVWSHVRHKEYIESGQNGGYIRSLFGKVTPLPPLALATPKLTGGSAQVTEVKPEIPRLGELIRDNLLIKEDEEGKPLMLQGFRADTTPRYGQWPGVIGVAGMQNVGKSVTIETLAIIGMMQGAQVVVCDTHHMKARSLYKKLSCLDGFIRFAKTEQEVAREARKFSQELAARKAGREAYPYIFILDEAASIVRSPIGDDVVNVVEEASQEGHGFHMHLVLAIHDFSKDGIGDARIRDFLNWIYCHRMQAGQSKFIAAFNTRKTKQMIAALPAGHTVSKDEVNEVDYLIMPFADGKDALAARKAMQDVRGLASVPAPEQVNPPALYTSTRLIPAPARPASQEPETEDFRLETSGFIQAETNGFTSEIEPLQPNRAREINAFSSQEDKAREIARLRSLGLRQSEILQRIWQVKPGATQAYQTALTEYKALLEIVVRSV